MADQESKCSLTPKPKLFLQCCLAFPDVGQRGNVPLQLLTHHPPAPGLQVSPRVGGGGEESEGVLREQASVWSWGPAVLQSLDESYSE